MILRQLPCGNNNDNDDDDDDSDDDDDNDGDDAISLQSTFNSR